ncbi:MAG: hypothetical protein DMF45_12890, partial [Verrucomicrobia bacterium]
FFDESYYYGNTQTKIIMASWAVEQDAWSWQVERLPELYKTPILDTINSMFDSLGARATVATATIDTTLASAITQNRPMSIT